MNFGFSGLAASRSWRKRSAPDSDSTLGNGVLQRTAPFVVAAQFYAEDFGLVNDDSACRQAHPTSRIVVPGGTPFIRVVFSGARSTKS